MGDFQPISLFNSIYLIITKVLANRLRGIGQLSTINSHTKKITTGWQEILYSRGREGGQRDSCESWTLPKHMQRRGISRGMGELG